MSADLADPAAAELAREQAWLVHARTQLQRMRARTEALRDSAIGGDRVSTEFLALRLHARVQSLADDPTTTLFFGALVFDHDIEGHERWYVGRRHIHDESGDPVVIDWRADLSGRFYRASRSQPLGVVLRRRFGVDRGQLTAYEDEHLTDPTEHTGRSAILAAEIERPRVGPMRDIVATIQPEQDEIVRADVTQTICVQGAPGTGKTAVGLHRAAWLLYAHRERLGRAGVLVVGPSATFLDHVGAVLPALGEVEVRHCTAAELVGTIPVRGTDSVAAATLKGDARLAEVLRRAVWSHISEPTEPLIVPRGARKWRVAAYRVADVIAELRKRQVRYGAARAMLAQRLAHLVLTEMERSGDSPDDSVQDAVARSAPVRAYAGRLWPDLKPATLLFGLWSDPVTLGRHAEGVLTAEEQRILVWAKAPRSPGAARWSAADAVLLDEIADLIDRTPSLGHVILDEAQDLSPMQLRAVGRRCSTGSATVLGDIAQGTTPWATNSWDESLTHLGKPGSHVEILDRGFRVPAAVIEYAARLLPHMAPGLGVPESVRENRGELALRRVAGAHVAVSVVAAVQEASAELGSIGVICADADVAGLAAALGGAGIRHTVLGGHASATEDRDEGRDEAERVAIVPAVEAKGLEFDRVIVVEPAAIAETEADHRTGLRRLYVVLTRAVSALTVVHARPLPVELAGPRSGESSAELA